MLKCENLLKRQRNGWEFNLDVCQYLQTFQCIEYHCTITTQTSHVKQWMVKMLFKFYSSELSYHFAYQFDTVDFVLHNNNKEQFSTIW